MLSVPLTVLAAACLPVGTTSTAYIWFFPDYLQCNDRVDLLMLGLPKVTGPKITCPRTLPNPSDLRPANLPLSSKSQKKSDREVQTKPGPQAKETGKGLAGEPLGDAQKLISAGVVV